MLRTANPQFTNPIISHFCDCVYIIRQKISKIKGKKCKISPFIPSINAKIPHFEGLFVLIELSEAGKPSRERAREERIG